MRYRYQDYPVDLLRQLLTMDELTKLFWQLVLQTGGDVEEALRWMKYLQERGLIDPGIDLAQFAKELEKRELVENQGGNLVLTGAAERQIRRQALEEVFSSLKKSGAGYHSIPHSGARNLLGTVLFSCITRRETVNSSGACLTPTPPPG